MHISQDITRELVLLFHSFLLGAAITFVYDGLLILRKLFKHVSFLISLEDLLFWIFCAVSVFGVLYRENNGMLRWFIIAGAALGMTAYKKTVSRVVIAGVSGALALVLKFLNKMLRLVGTPFLLLWKKVKAGSGAVDEKARIFGRYMKKKLTGLKKEFKIIMNKQ